MKHNQSGCEGLHPATRFFLWVCLIVAQLSLEVIPLLLLGMVAIFFASTSAGSLSRRILWRSRILLLSIILVLPWATPGVYAVDFMGMLSPTREGLHVVLQQLLHSVVVLVGLGWALAGLDANARTAGLIFWLRPLAKTGFPIERFAVRLMLTLQILETTPRYTSWQKWKLDWQGVLGIEMQEAKEQEMVIYIGRISWLDRLMMAMALLGVVLCVGL